MPNLIFFVNKTNRCTSFSHNKLLDADQFFLSGRLSTCFNSVVMDFFSDFYYVVAGFMIFVASVRDQIVYSPESENVDFFLTLECTFRPF